MYAKTIRRMGCGCLLLLLAREVPAETFPVVLWTGDYVTTTVNFKLPAASDNGSTRTWPYSDTTDITPTSGYTVPSGQSGTFYGMFQQTTAGSPNNFSQIGFANDAAGDYFRLTGQNGTLIETFIFFKKANFLNGFDAGTLAVNGLEGTIGVNSVAGDTITVRFALRHNGTWYLSETTVNSTGSFNINNLGAGNWGAWNPSGSPAAAAPASFTTAGSSLTDVDALGFYFSAQRAGSAPRVWVNKFEILGTPASGNPELIYDGNGNTGGTVPVDENIYEVDDTATVAANTGNLTRNNYVFAGWNTEPNGTGTAVNGGDTVSFTSIASITLYAQWIPVAFDATLVPQYWGGGASDIANGTALPVTSNGLSGAWNTTTKNWANNTAGSTYATHANGTMAVLGFYNASSPSHANIDLQDDVEVSGLLMSLSATSDQNHRFALTSAVPRTISLIGTNALINITAQGTRRGLDMVNISLASSVPVKKTGDSLWDIHAASPYLRSPVVIQGGEVTLRADQAWSAVSNLMIRGFPSRSSDTLDGNNFAWPRINLIASGAGTIQQLHTNATITLARGGFYYQGRRDNIQENVSRQVISKIVLAPQGSISLADASATGTYPAQLIVTNGIDRGPSGRGTLLIVGTNMATDLIVSQGVTAGGTLPWIANNRGEFIQLNSITRAMERVPATAAPTDLSSWSPGNDYRVGNNNSFSPSGEIGNTSINSLGLYANDSTTLTIGNGNKLTISSGGIAHQASGFNKTTMITGGQITSGGDELVIHGGDSSDTHTLVIRSSIVNPAGTSMNLIKAGVSSLVLAGTEANTYSGTTYVNMGIITTFKTNAIAIPGDLVLQRGGSAILNGVGSQVASTSKITIEEDGLFSAVNNSPTHQALITINGGTYRVANRQPTINVSGTGLAFNGGRIEHRSTSTGTFSLQTDVSYASSSTRPAIWNRISTGDFNIELDGANRTFNIAKSTNLPPGQAEMVFLVPIVDGSPAGGRLIKTGTGTLQLTATNTYTGGTTINQGTLHVVNYNAPAITSLRASSLNAGSHGSLITFHTPVATNLLIGQSISGTGISANRVVVEVMDPFMIQSSGGNAATNANDIAIGSIQRFGTLGTGAVTNNGGTLLVDAGVILANNLFLNAGTITNNGTLSGVVILNGGVMTGTGTNTGNTIINSGVVTKKLGGGLTVNGSLSPAGTSTGTLEVVGNLVWNSGASFSAATDWLFDVGADDVSDRVTIDGNFNIGSGSAFRFDFRGFAGSGTFTLVTWTGSTSFQATDFSAINLAPGYAAAFSMNESSLIVTVGACETSSDVSLGTVAARCSPSVDTSVTIAHTTTPEAVSYTIDFSDSANSAGFADVINQSFTTNALPFTIPAGIASGTYTAQVVMTDASGCIGSAEFTVTINAVPPVPGAISQAGGGTDVCYGSSSVTYSIAAVAGATTYNWVAPSGASIVSGQNTTSIVLNWGNAAPGSANLQVRAANACGNGEYRTTSFNIIAEVPDAPTALEATDITTRSFLARWSAPAPRANINLQGYRLDVSSSSDFTGGFPTNNGMVVSNYVVSSGQTSLLITGLVEGATYYYRVRAANACGSSTNSDAIEVLTPQVLAGWNTSELTGGSGDYGPSPFDASQSHPGLTVVGWTRGAGLSQSGAGSARGWGATGWSTSDANAAIAAGKYATFTVTTIEGNNVSFKSLVTFDYRRSATGPANGTLQYALDGSTFTDLASLSYPGTSVEGVTLTGLPVDLSGVEALQDIPPGETVTFRLVNYNAVSSDGDWYIYDRANDALDDFIISGTVCSNPPTFNVTGGGAFCAGGSGVSIGLSGSSLGVTYYLYRNSGATLVATRAGTGSAITFGTYTTEDTYTVQAIRNSGGCSTLMSGEAVVTATVTPAPPVEIIANTGENQASLNWDTPAGELTGYRITRSDSIGGTYTTVSGGSNVAVTNFTDTTAFNGNTYYYRVIVLNGSCAGTPSDPVEVIMPAGCPPGNAPVLSNPGNRTVIVGSLLTYSISASEISADCAAPGITNSSLPGGMTFEDSVNNANRTRTFSWVPENGQQGAYPITVTATDSEDLTARRTFTIYVGNTGESGGGGSTPPPSLANWSVAITNVAPAGGASYNVVWETAPDVGYDVYTTTNFPAGPWIRVADDETTSESSNEVSISHSGERTFFQVVPGGSTPGTNGVWGIATPTIPTGFSMQAPPLLSDRRFDGELGAALATALPTGTEVMLMTPGTSPDWTTLRLSAGGDWLIDGTETIYSTPLAAGQGYYINRPSGSDKPLFQGPVGNNGSASITLQAGYNLISISEGKSVAASTAFESATPIGSSNPSLADQIIVLNADRSWRVLRRRSNSTWWDSAQPTSTGNTSLTLPPGQSYYYLRRTSSSTLEF